MKMYGILRWMARDMAQHGFSPELRYRGACCFIGELRRAHEAGLTNYDDAEDATIYLRKHLLADDPCAFSVDSLQRECWTTRDAVAALEMAADLAQCEDR